MPQKLGPGAIRCICEILHRPFAGTVPAGYRLVEALPEKWETRVAVAVNSHVAGEATSGRART
jgi:hypothetical protein